MSVAASEAQQTRPIPRARSRASSSRAWAEKGLIPGIFLAIAALLPFILAIGDKATSCSSCAVALAYVVMALGLNIVVGFAGLLDLGYVAFFAIGAYAVGWFASGLLRVRQQRGRASTSSSAASRRTCQGIHFNFLIVLVIAVILTTIAGMIIGLPTLRLRGDYIAIVTLAFGEIIGRLAVNLRRHRRSSAARRSPPAARASRRSTGSTCRSWTHSRSWT